MLIIEASGFTSHLPNVPRKYSQARLDSMGCMDYAIHSNHPTHFSSTLCQNRIILHAIADEEIISDTEEENEAKTTGRRRFFPWRVKDYIPVLPMLTSRRKLHNINDDTFFTNDTNSDTKLSKIKSTSSLVKPSSKPKKKPKDKKKINSFIHRVETLQQYKEIVADDTEKIVVVRFYAEWCKACKAIAPSFRRLAHFYSKVNNEEGNDVMKGIKFVEVPLTKENAVLHQGLGVPSLPFGHIYYPNIGLVEERKISKKKFQIFERVIGTYVNGCCDLNDAISIEDKRESNLITEEDVSLDKQLDLL